MTPRYPVRIRQGNLRITRRADGVVQGYHVGSPVAGDPDARAAFNSRPSRSLFDTVTPSPTAPDLEGARSASVGWRRAVHVTDGLFVLEEWNGRALDYRSVERSADNDAAIRGLYPEVFDD